jgi:fido (protein-threonine AMPylation protein)
MATPRQKFAAALTALKNLQDHGTVTFYTTEFPNRNYREILIKNGFIKEVLKGWYISSHPGSDFGDTTAWYSSYWDFCVKFLKFKYQNDWCLSADQSLKIHAGNWSVPNQLFVRSPMGNNHPTPFPHHTSLFNYQAELPDSSILMTERDLRIYTLAGSLIYCTKGMFASNPIDTRTALSLIRDASEVLPLLLEKGHSTISGRLAGAFRNINRAKIADQIVATMKAAGYDIREEDPFKEQINIDLSMRERSPFVNRLKLMWQQMRRVIIADFPKSPGIQNDHEAYLKDVDEVYLTDAYHSLSIERYKVTPELIARVSSGQWDNTVNPEDKKQQDAMAARGYYQAFQEVKKTIIKILNGANAGKEADGDHQKWFRELFDPSVAAGLLRASDLAGYRSGPIYIKGAQHVPLSADAMRDAMPILFELLENEPEASVRAVLGHFIFVFIHPYSDGNGRMGRFLLNVMLSSGGYPWTVIPVEKRKDYMTALEQASTGQDISAFSKFISHLVVENIKGKPVARLP